MNTNLNAGTSLTSRAYDAANFFFLAIMFAAIIAAGSTVLTAVILY